MNFSAKTVRKPFRLRCLQEYLRRQPQIIKKLLYGVMTGIGLLLLALIVLVIMLLGKKDSPVTTPADNATQTSQRSTSSSATSTGTKKKSF